MKVSGSFRSRKNACRDLTRLIKRTPGATLKVPIEVCKIHIRLRKPLRCMEVWWPHISMREWCRFFVSSKPQLRLAGRTPEQNWMEIFRTFWADYRLIDPNHPVYGTGYNLGACVPYFVHGDEGRGQNKRPYMVLSWQPVIGHMGIGATNDTSYLGCYLAP